VNQKPQTLGSMITYWRRYSFSAAINIVVEDDDDGQRAQNDHGSRQSAGDVWENAKPASSRPMNQGPRQEITNGNGQPRGQVSRPAQPAKPATAPAADGDAEEVDIDAQAYADEAHGALTANDLEGIHERARLAGKVAGMVRNPASDGKGKPGQLALYLDWKRKQLKEIDDATAALLAAAEETGFPVAEIETHVRSVTDTDLETATAAQIRHATQALWAMQGVPA
jgi:hypothetical protein